MSNNKKSFYERITRPIEGFFPKAYPLDVIMDIHFEVRKARRDKDLVSYHKIKLGKQTTTFTTDQRLWVWDKPKYRLFVGNSKGICIEIDEKASKVDAAQALKDYVKEMKVPINVDSYLMKENKE